MANKEQIEQERADRAAEREQTQEQRNQNRDEMRAELLAEQEAEKQRKADEQKAKDEVAAKNKKQAIYDALDNLDDTILEGKRKDPLNWYQHEGVRVALRHYGAQL